jgi:hypothetical protein
MTAVTHIDPGAQIAQVTASGPISKTDIYGFLESLCAEPRFRPQMAGLRDVRQTDPDVSLDDIRAIAAKARSMATGPCGRTAIVALTDFQFGLAMQLQALVCDRPCEVGVFRRYENAVTWLSADNE